MKKNGFIVELATVAALVAISSTASANYTFAPFFDDAEVSLRNATKHEGEYRWNPNKEDMDYQYQTASAFTARFNSGFVGRGKAKMGFDIGALGTLNLGEHNWNDDYYNGSEPLAQENCTPNEKGIMQCDAKGYARMSVLSAKIRLGKSWNERADIEMGLGHYEGGLIKTNDPDDSLVPNSYRGISINGRTSGYEYSAIWVDRFIRNGLDKLSAVKIYDNDAKESPVYVEVPFVYGFGIAKRTQSFAVSFATGFSKDYLSRYTLFGKRGLRLGGGHNLEFTSAFQVNQYSGSVYEEAVEKGILEQGMDHSRLIDVTARYFNDNWSVTLGHTTASGNTPFRYAYDGVDGIIYDSGKAEVMSYFRRPGDKQYSLKSTYHFKGDNIPAWLNGLSPFYNLHYFVRPDAEQKVNWQVVGHEKATGIEHVLGVSYEPRAGVLKGTQVRLLGAFYRPDEKLVTYSANDPKDKFDINHFELEVKFPIF